MESAPIGDQVGAVLGAAHERIAQEYKHRFKEIIPDQCDCCESKALVKNAADFAVEHSVQVELIEEGIAELVGGCEGHTIKKIGSCGTKKKICHSSEAHNLPDFFKAQTIG